MPDYLALPCVPPETIRSLRLGVEIKLPGSAHQLKNFEGLIRAAHLPYAIGGVRLNIASEDRQFRQYSIDQFKLHARLAARLGIEKVITHTAPEFWDGEQVATYDCFLENYRDFAEYCKRLGLLCLLENMVRYWRPQELHLPPEEIDLGDHNRYFGTTAEEWQKLHQDIGQDNVFLCLDTSHAVTVAVGTSDVKQREWTLFAFLKEPQRIAHVHWSANDLYHQVRGRRDNHLPLQNGLLPRSFQTAIKALPVTKTFEMLTDENELRATLTLVAGL